MPAGQIFGTDFSPDIFCMKSIKNLVEFFIIGTELIRATLKKFNGF
jgi:hypothetical protein